ncbi:MAG: hypothetical protein KAI66_02090 [Lentisphaeria bacterium]|nr:hypothetical protein [Lentisphaeria bacterium]
MMNIFSRLFFLVAIALLTNGCAMRGYMGNRGRDIADVLTFSVGTGLGVKAQLGPLHFTPVLMCADQAGLRGGEVFAVSAGDEDLEHIPLSVGALWWANDVFWLPQDGERLQARGKAVFAFPPGARDDQQFSLASETIPFVCVPRMKWESEGLVLKKYPAHYLTQLEVVVAVMGSVRLGVNPGELVDLVVGFFGLDLYGDDLGGRRDGRSPRLVAPKSGTAAPVQAPDTELDRRAAAEGDDKPE